MDNIKNIITGGIITLVIGGAAFTFTQEDLIKNFANETGLTQEQAQQYAENISEDELTSFKEAGADYIKEGEEIIEIADRIDCVNYEYEWESPALSCNEGKSQLMKIGNTSKELGHAYLQLDSDKASESDMYNAIRYLDQLNSDYQLSILTTFFDRATLEEMMMTNSYNKSILKSALESKQ